MIGRSICPGTSASNSLGYTLTTVPGQQVFELVTGMAGNTRQKVGEPVLPINIVGLGGYDEAVHEKRSATRCDRSRRTTAVAPGNVR